MEDAEDYKAFEISITAAFDAQTAVERELVLRLASVMWRLRRSTAIETGLLQTGKQSEAVNAEMALRFIRLAKFDHGAFDRLNRYETALRRQTAQLLFALNYLHRPPRRQFSRWREDPQPLGARRERV
jgi:hypothetical protein